MKKQRKMCWSAFMAKRTLRVLRHFFQSVYYLLYVRKLSQLVDFEESYPLAFIDDHVCSLRETILCSEYSIQFCYFAMWPKIRERALLTI